MAQVETLGLVGTSIEDFRIFPNTLIFGDSTKIQATLMEHLHIFHNPIPNADVEIYVDNYKYDTTRTDSNGRILHPIIAENLGVGNHIIQLHFLGDWIHYGECWSSKGELRIRKDDYAPSPPQPPIPIDWMTLLKYGIIGVGLIGGGYYIYKGLNK